MIFSENGFLNGNPSYNSCSNWKVKTMTVCVINVEQIMVAFDVPTASVTWPIATIAS